MTHILHITCDYIDEIDDDKTPAVSNLVKYSKNLEHTVFSLNRTVRPTLARRSLRNDRLHSIYHFGLPFGIGLRFFLRETAKRLLRIIQDNGIRPDIVHCHKLTVEGLIGSYISKQLDVPMICSFRGDTDFKLIRFKPGYRGLYKRALRQSASVLYIAPWAKEKLERMWPGNTPQHSEMLPNIVNLSFDKSGRVSPPATKLVTVCHLKDYKRKNLFRLFDALDECITDGLDTSLDIVGGGTNELTSLIAGHLCRLKNSSRFRLVGPLTRSELDESLGDYAGLVLASYPETFGMVYLEALQAGIPILHSVNAGVDGYFDNKGVSVTVDPSSIDSIKTGISSVINRQLEMKSAVRKLSETGYMEQFNTENIIDIYETTVTRAVESYRTALAN